MAKRAVPLRGSAGCKWSNANVSEAAVSAGREVVVVGLMGAVANGCRGKRGRDKRRRAK